MKIASPSRSRRLAFVPVAASLVLGACTVMPTGPSVMALPGSRMTLEQFQADTFDCQRYAQTVVASAGGAVAANADNATAATAAAGAVTGAAMGALIGSATGQAGQGAAIGAGTGLLFGGMSGSYYGSMSSYQLQRGYDGAYLDCMYSRGHRVPAPRGYSASARGSSGYPNGAPSAYPPPNQPPPAKSSIVGPTKPVYAPSQGSPSSGSAPAGSTPAPYPAPPNVPPSSYPPPDAPPPSGPPSKG